MNRLAESDRYSIELRAAEQVEEMQSRLRRDEAEATHKQNVEWAEAVHRRRVFWAVFAVVIAAGVAALAIVIVGDNVSPETEEWARTVVSAIVAGLVGYFGGSATRSEK